MERNRILSPRVMYWACCYGSWPSPMAPLAAKGSFIGSFGTVTTLSKTVPGNGDQNPYGVTKVPESKGSLVEGRFLISNFNNGANKQGTGTTIVQIAPDGTFSLFARSMQARCRAPEALD